MNLNTSAVWSMLSAAAPLFAVLAFFLDFNRKRRRGRARPGRPGSGFSPSTFTLGIALQHLHAFTHPSIQYVLEQSYDEDADEGDQSDPDDLKAQLHRQLKRVRRGEPVDHLILRLK